MDLRLGGWYAPIENMINGGEHNARIIEDSIAATSICAEYCHRDMSFLLHLFGGNVVRTVEHSVPAFADGFSCWAYPGRSLRVAWSIYHITLWTSEGGQLVN